MNTHLSKNMLDANSTCIHAWLFNVVHLVNNFISYLYDFAAFADFGNKGKGKLNKKRRKKKKPTSNHI